jgi:Mor family transcriptional regulator
MDLKETKYKGIYVTEEGGVYRTGKDGIYRCAGSPKTKRYLSITVNKKTVTFHRLVYETFRGAIPEGMEINHKNTNTHKNELSNLEVVTPNENIDHAGRMGKHTKRISDNQCADMIKAVLEGASVHEVAKINGVGHNYLFEIMRKEKRLNAWEIVGVDTATIATNKMPVDVCATMIREALAGTPKPELQLKYNISRSQLFKILRKDFREDAWKLLEGSTTIP